MERLDALTLLPSLRLGSIDSSATEDPIAVMAANALASLCESMTQDAACARFKLAEDPATAGKTPLVVLQAVKRLYSDALTSNASDAKFAKGLSKLGLPDKTAATLASVFSERRQATVSAIRSNAAVAAGGPGVLQDFDWSVQHILSSDRLNSMGDSHVALSLRVAPSSSSAGTSSAPTKDLAVELSAAELDALIGELEKVVQ